MSQTQTEHFRITSQDQILATFESTLQRLRDRRTQIFLSRQTLIDLKTAFVEAVANAIKHARELNRRGVVTGRFFLSDRQIGFDVFDHGRGFKIGAVPVPNLANPQASGRGLFMLKQLGDVLTYKKQAKKNVLNFKRHLIGQDASARELDLFYELSEAMIHNASLSSVYELILNRALELFHVERASILAYDAALKSLKVVASRGIKKDVAKKIRVRSGEGVSGYVFQHGRPLLIEDVSRNKRGIEQKKQYKTRSFISAPMICSPLRLDEKSVGVINLTDRIDGKRFTKKDLKLLSTIANQAMACLHIRDLVKELHQSACLKREMENVQRIQASYLPKQSPIVAGFDIAGRCAMAQAAGGDYFDFFLKGHFLYVAIADVAGHDTTSAVTMVNLRARLASLIAYEKLPARILDQLNTGLFADLSHLEQFISCLLVRINTQTGECVVANAGHYPPLFFSGQVLLGESGLVLGVDSTETYCDEFVTLAPDDGLLIYTDGVIESTARDGSLFGIDRLKKIIAQSKKDPSAPLRARKIVDSIIKTVTVDQTGQRQRDDVTVVVVKRSV